MDIKFKRPLLASWIGWLIAGVVIYTIVASVDTHVSAIWMVVPILGAGVVQTMMSYRKTNVILYYFLILLYVISIGVLVVNSRYIEGVYFLVFGLVVFYRLWYMMGVKDD